MPGPPEVNADASHDRPPRSPATVLNIFAPRRGIDVTRSVIYGSGRRGTLDIYRPVGAKAAPVVVFFYGGSWQNGTKSLYGFLGAALARRGYVVAVPDYRLYPEVRYPDFILDGARAVRWIADNAAWYGGNATDIFLMGHSAGAYIAAMLAIDSRWLREAGAAFAHRIAGLIGVAGPYDFLPLRDETLKTIFGGANQPEALPITYVASGAPPALLLTGATDGMVSPGNSTRLASRLASAGNEADAVTYPRVGHLTIMAAFARPFRFLAPALRDTDAFIARIVRARAEAVGVASGAGA